MEIIGRQAKPPDLIEALADIREAAVRTVVATARLTDGATTFSTVLGTIGA